MRLLLNGDLNMRLYNVYYICKSIYPDLNNLKVESAPGGTYRLKGWENYKKALQTLRTIDFISKDAISTYDILNPIDSEKKVPEIGKNTYNELSSQNHILLTKI